MIDTWDGTATDVCPLSGDEPIRLPVGLVCGRGPRAVGCNGDGYEMGKWKGPTEGGYWYWLCRYCDGTGRQKRHVPHGEPVRYESAIAAFRAVKAIRGLQ